ncbi:MAG: T9SS type A sorting domain-containing protein, partial [candidate division WOR-3 bacterium]
MAGDRTGYLTLFLETGSGLAAGTHIKRDSGGVLVDIMVNYNSYPFINDWNEDGKKDLIVGEQSYVSPNTGNIRVYLNNGTNASPRFGNYSVIYAGGSQLYIYRANPTVYDLDRDGLKDLVIGNDDGCVYFYKNVGTNANPVFTAARETLRTVDGTIIDAYYGSRINFVDWRGDGDLDMLISGYDGYVQLYENATVEIETGEAKDLVTSDFRVTPNPVMDRAVISYTLVNRSPVELKIYSTDGRLITTLLNRYEDAGAHRFIWNIKNDLPAGVYLLYLT